jgi:hypothetical protein
LQESSGRKPMRSLSELNSHQAVGEGGLNAEAMPRVPPADERQIESGVMYLRPNFLCGPQGREPACLDDFNAEHRQ